MNVTAAVRHYLVNYTPDASEVQPAVSRLVGDRVFGPPGNQEDDPLRKEMKTWGNKPNPTVVVMASGGAGSGRGARTTQKWTENRLDVRCYGASPLEADKVHNAVYRAMAVLDNHLYETDDPADCTRLVSAEVGGGPLPARDADGDWPFTLGVYIVSAKFA